MRDGKLEEIKSKIEKLKTINLELIEQDNYFVTIEPYKVTLNNGMTIFREKILKANKDGSSVSILPILKDTKEIVLVIEPRVFTELTVGVSVPAGYVDNKEEPIMAARRELEEECGIKSSNLICTGDYYKDFGNSSGISTQFIALDSEFTGNTHFDDDEVIESVLVTLEEAKELIKMKYIRDACSIMLINEADKYL